MGHGVSMQTLVASWQGVHDLCDELRVHVSNADSEGWLEYNSELLQEAAVKEESGKDNLGKNMDVDKDS